MHHWTSTGGDELRSAAEQGRIAALAGAGQRDLQRCASAHPELFPARPFDPALFSGVALATAFGVPWCDAEQLRVANRTALWIFAADWLIDTLATARDQVDRIVTGCRAVAEGAPAPPGDPLAAFLVTIRDEVAAAPAYREHGPRWRAELDRMLTAMAREWDWKAARTEHLTDGPTFAEYLDNADNFGSTFVNVSHWMVLGEPASLAHLTALTTASRAVQRVLRLVNDLATYRRDVGWGDLNALMLTGDPAVVHREIDEQVRHCQELLEPLAVVAARDVTYLARQIGFSTGFYQLNDFWGSR